MPPPVQRDKGLAHHLEGSEEEESQRGCVLGESREQRLLWNVGRLSGNYGDAVKHA